MIDILGIGEALIEYSEQSNGIYRQSFAGDVLNTLYYASRLGCRVSFFSQFGQDSFTNDLIAFLDRTGIDHNNCIRSTDKNNGLYIIRNANDGEPSFTFFRENSAAREAFVSNAVNQLHQYFQDAKVLIISAIGLAIFRNVESLIELLKVKPPGQRIYFDANVRETLWKDKQRLRQWLVELAPIVDVLSISVSDDEKLFSKRAPKEILEFYISLGYQTVILRNGAEDVLLYANNSIDTIPVEKVSTVVDATGAGDAFNAGYICSMLRQCSPKDSVVNGNKAARQILAYHGGIVTDFDPSSVFLS